MTTEQLERMKEELSLLTIPDVMFITSWGRKTVIDIMKEEDFPVIKVGKDNQVSFEALKEYVKHRRIKRGDNNA